MIRARSPLRISFAGGGTDVSPYLEERGGAVLSATINRYAYATVIPAGKQFTIRSLDYDATISFGIDDPLVYDGQLDLAKAVINYFRRAYGLRQGLDILLHNDAPPGSGLGSSSAIVIALIRALAEFMRVPMDAYRLADLAFHIERIECGQIGGKQDQYATAFGGFNFIEFNRDSTLVHQLRLKPETVFELEYRLIFAYVGGKRVFSNILSKQVSNYENRDRVATDAMDSLKSLAYDMKKALLLGNLREFAELLDVSWHNKKRMAEGITNPTIDGVYEAAKSAGASGGKVTGAGGGGFMFFICEADRCHFVQDALKANGCQLVNFSFVEEGAWAWELPDARPAAAELLTA